jgi:hypothetical protein
MRQKSKSLIILVWCVITVMIGTAARSDAEIPRLARLKCPQLYLTLRAVQQAFPLSLPGGNRAERQRGAWLFPPTIVGGNQKGGQVVFSFRENDSSAPSESDSSSWIPRIVVPVLAVAVLATATYLLYSRRGG